MSLNLKKIQKQYWCKKRNFKNVSQICDDCERSITVNYQKMGKVWRWHVVAFRTIMSRRLQSPFDWHFPLGMNQKGEGQPRSLLESRRHSRCSTSSVPMINLSKPKGKNGIGWTLWLKIWHCKRVHTLVDETRLFSVRSYDCRHQALQLVLYRRSCLHHFQLTELP